VTARKPVRVDINIPLAMGVAHGAAERGVRAATEEARAQLVLMLSRPGSGKVYPRGKRAQHQASAPGEPPAPDTGRLRNSITTEVFRTTDGALGLVSANTEYAAGLELGTEKAKARPFISRVVAEQGDRIRRVFELFARV
jgi:phage gpG-like protein